MMGSRPASVSALRVDLAPTLRACLVIVLRYDAKPGATSIL